MNYNQKKEATLKAIRQALKAFDDVKQTSGALRSGIDMTITAENEAGVMRAVGYIAANDDLMQPAIKDLSEALNQISELTGVRSD